MDDHKLIELPDNNYRIVEVKCIFIHISQIDTVKENYRADIHLEAKWRESLLDNCLDIENVNLNEFWNPKIYVENAINDLNESQNLSINFDKITNNAFIVEKRRIKGILHETLELQQFPFDCQDLSVTISTCLPIEEVKLMESDNDISRLNLSEVLESQEWKLYKHVEVSFDEVYSDSSIGPPKRQTMKFTCRASRRFAYFIINYLMISSLLSFMAFCSFGITVSNTFNRLQMCMINLLTNVAFKVALGQSLPKISYLTYMDKALLGNLCTIMCLIFWHVGTSLFFKALINNTSDTSTSSSIKTALMVAYVHEIEMILIPSAFGVYLLGILIYGIMIYFDAGRRRRKMREKDNEFLKKINQLDA